MELKRLPIVRLEIEEEQRLYYADARLGHYRSVDGREPRIVYEMEINGTMDEVIAHHLFTPEA